MSVPRISQKYLELYGDKEITKLVNEYYVMFDSINQSSGGMQINIQEVLAIKKYLNGRKFNRFLEIGVCDGGSLWLYGNLFCTPASIIGTIDRKATPCGSLVIKELRRQDKLVFSYEEDCNDIRDAFPDKYFDFIHLDGDHHYEAVKKDFDSYIPKLTDDGVMLIHDTNSDKGARDFVNAEVKPFYKCIDFIGKGYVASTSACDAIETGTTLIERK